MIIQWFADMFYKIFTGLLNWINLPSLPSDFYSIPDYVNLIIENGASILNFFLPSHVFKVCFPIFLAITGFKYGYYLVMWILKKIPAVGIS